MSGIATPNPSGPQRIEFSSGPSSFLMGSTRQRDVTGRKLKGMARLPSFGQTKKILKIHLMEKLENVAVLVRTH